MVFNIQFKYLIFIKNNLINITIRDNGFFKIGNLLIYNKAGVSNKFSHLESVSNCMSVENNVIFEINIVTWYTRTYKEI
jgi:hypothetical protein